MTAQPDLIEMPVSVPDWYGCCYPNHANIYLQHAVGVNRLCCRCRKSFRSKKNVPRQPLPNEPGNHDGKQ